MELVDPDQPLKETALYVTCYDGLRIRVATLPKVLILVFQVVR
jgi:hypothetical protein